MDKSTRIGIFQEGCSCEIWSKNQNNGIGLVKRQSLASVETSVKFTDRLSLTAVLSERQKAVDKLNLGERSETQELGLTTGLFSSFSNPQKQYYAIVCAVSRITRITRISRITSMANFLIKYNSCVYK